MPHQESCFLVVQYSNQSAVPTLQGSTHYGEWSSLFLDVENTPLDYLRDLNPTLFIDEASTFCICANLLCIVSHCTVIVFLRRYSNDECVTYLCVNQPQQLTVESFSSCYILTVPRRRVRFTELQGEGLRREHDLYIGLLDGLLLLLLLHAIGVRCCCPCVRRLQPFVAVANILEIVFSTVARIQGGGLRPADGST